jgi:hypothetical protein
VGLFSQKKNEVKKVKSNLSQKIRVISTAMIPTFLRNMPLMIEKIVNSCGNTLYLAMKVLE